MFCQHFNCNNFNWPQPKEDLAVVKAHFINQQYCNCNFVEFVIY